MALANEGTAARPAALFSEQSVAVGTMDRRAIIAGSIGAAAIAALLFGSGSTFGLSMTTASPRTFGGFSGATLIVVMTVWFGLVHVSALAAGGYIAGRARAPSQQSAVDADFIEGAHVFLVWALGTLLGAYLLASAATAVAGKAVGAAGQAVAGAASVATSRAAEQAADRSDRIMRKKLLASAPVAAAPGDSGANGRTKAELTRMFANGIVQGALLQPDKDYLARTVTVRSGMADPGATARVEDAPNTLLRTKADADIKARDATERARKSSILSAVMMAAISLAGLIGAVWGASTWATDRKENRSPRVLVARRA